jgi:HSP20 family protein
MQVRRVPTHNSESSQGNYPSVNSPFLLFEDFYRDWMPRATETQGESWKPPADILEKDGNIFLYTELPGVNEKDIELKLEGTVLTIKGEKKQIPDSGGYSPYRIESCNGPFSRSFTLPDSIDTDKVTAQYKNGILTITLPSKPEVKPRSIKINS